MTTNSFYEQIPRAGLRSALLERVRLRGDPHVILQQAILQVRVQELDVTILERLLQVPGAQINECTQIGAAIQNTRDPPLPKFCFQRRGKLLGDKGKVNPQATA